MALKDLIQRVATLQVCFIEKRGNKHPSNKTVCPVVIVALRSFVFSAIHFPKSRLSGSLQGFYRIPYARGITIRLNRSPSLIDQLQNMN